MCLGCIDHQEHKSVQAGSIEAQAIICSWMKNNLKFKLDSSETLAKLFFPGKKKYLGKSIWECNLTFHFLWSSILLSHFLPGSKWTLTKSSGMKMKYLQSCLMAQTCNSSTGKAEGQGLLRGRGQSELHTTRLSERGGARQKGTEIVFINC